jgi:hypothetical protein
MTVEEAADDKLSRRMLIDALNGRGFSVEVGVGMTKLGYAEFTGNQHNPKWAWFIMRLFHARTAAHILHLKTRSFAAHKALNEFYDALPDLADTLAETYQGQYGLIDEFPPRYIPQSEPLDMLDGLRAYIQENRCCACDKKDTHLQNIIDEIVALIDQTTYKLKFLR